MGSLSTDEITDWVLKNWIEPCQAKVPRVVHGACTHTPVFIMMAAFLVLVSILSWYESRRTVRAPAPSDKASKTKGE